MSIPDDVKAIDAVMNLHTPQVVDEIRPSYSADFLGGKVNVPESTVAGLTLDEIIAQMDAAGIERALIPAVKCGPLGNPVNWHLPPELVVEAVQAHPDRFWGLAGIDPTQGMRGVKALERDVKEYGFVGAHLYPHWFEMSPDHRKLYPFYAKCVELDIPIQMQVGHCHRYSPDRPFPNVGKPITLDTIACDFPELKLVGIHIGWPWTEEMIAVAYKHPNVYIGSDAYAPKYWAKEFVHYINTFGQDKVIFGTDFPVVGLERAMTEIADLNLRPDSARKFLRDNVINLYGLDV